MSRGCLASLASLFRSSSSDSNSPLTRSSSSSSTASSALLNENSSIPRYGSWSQHTHSPSERTLYRTSAMSRFSKFGATGLGAGAGAPLAIVDMGSNGIRFGIIAAMDRHLPVLYEERAPISLFDAQFASDDEGDDLVSNVDAPVADNLGVTMVDSTAIAPTNGKGTTGTPSEDGRRAISEEVMEQVISTFERWQALCQQSGVQQVRVMATEATRTAPNSKEFLARIKHATGWTVELLSKKEEAEVGAAGVMASYHTVQGLFMDLGGGSVQLNYIMRGAQAGAGKSSDTAQSWPYGAAALSRRLNACGSDQAAREVIFNEMVEKFKSGLVDINVPDVIEKDAAQRGGYRLYLSGGGFRALGYLLMAKQSSGKGNTRYPIPAINGFMATGKELAALVKEYRVLRPEEVPTAFRVSKRRAKLIPACALLMSAVMKVIDVKEVLFSEGGVRQGGCFGMLPIEVQNKDPALEAVKSFLLETNQLISDSDLLALEHFVTSSIPKNLTQNLVTSTAALKAAEEASSSSSSSPPAVSSKDTANIQLYVDSLDRLIPILCLTMFCYGNMPKEARSTSAWQLFLPGGALANCPGLTHGDRAILATILTERHEGDLADPQSGDAVKKLVPGSKATRQMCKYIGQILALAGLCAPLPGVPTMLLGGGGATKHGGRVYFEEAPSRRVDNESLDGGSGSGGGTGGGKVVILSTFQGQGQEHVVVKVEKGHPLLGAPVVSLAVDGLAKLAAKTKV